MAIVNIVPSTINATSTVSGTVAALKHITSGNVNAASTLSGSFSKARVLIASNINAVSTLSGAFVLKPGNILPAQINAKSIIYEVGIIFKTVPAGYYGVSDIDNGIII